MECRDVRELTDSFLSEQLLVETTHDILRHLAQCPSCRAEMESRRRLRTALRGSIRAVTRVARHPRVPRRPSGGMFANINPHDPSSGALVLRPMMAIAASLLLVSAVAFGGPRMARRLASARGAGRSSELRDSIPLEREADLPRGGGATVRTGIPFARRRRAVTGAAVQRRADGARAPLVRLRSPALCAHRPSLPRDPCVCARHAGPSGPSPLRGGSRGHSSVVVPRRPICRVRRLVRQRCRNARDRGRSCRTAEERARRRVGNISSPIAPLALA